MYQILSENEMKYNFFYRAEIIKIREELTTVPSNERKELEDRITVQDFAVCIPRDVGSI